jgi:predicted transcriptional regulator
LVKLEKKKGEKKMGYTLIFNDATEGLTLAQKGLYLYMRQQKEDYGFDVDVMSYTLDTSVYLIRKALKELIELGLVHRIQERVKGFVKYIYKALKHKEEVRDDVVLMKRKGAKKTIEKEPIQEVKKIEPKKEIEQKEVVEQDEQKDWVVLFKEHEDLIPEFIEFRKKWLKKCEFYKNTPELVTDSVAKNNIQKKMNEKNSTMPESISEFIKSKIAANKAKTEAVKETTLTEAQRLKNEMTDKINEEKMKLSKEKFPDFWSRKTTGFFNMAFMQERAALELTIEEDLDEIVRNIEAKYKPLIEKAQHE